ncbi:hypothetical protein R1sor_015719 [Riccia sorocarpa]|uniref:Haloacid dehalogenase-like hydrolase domain-containing protein 3 n=1 Tax=Riccia sorocarpa TaxID=122646 RepID=A0ABD3HGD3_9MARC
MHAVQSILQSGESIRPLSSILGQKVVGLRLKCNVHTNGFVDRRVLRPRRLAIFYAREEKVNISGKDFKGLEVMGEVPVLSTKSRNVGGVFFDLDDTLVLTHQADSAAHSAVLELVKVRFPQVDRSVLLKSFIKKFVGHAWDPEHKVEVTQWRAGLWGKALEEQGVVNLDLAREMQDVFDRERLRSFRWASGVEALVRQLHAQHIKVGIITNGHPVVQRAKLQACKASELFDTILVGGEEPNSKPHKDIFLKACGLAGCKPEESVMVGDTLTTDILGGFNTGFLSTVWVNVHNEELPPGGPKPDHIISSISELENVLKQLGVALN